MASTSARPTQHRHHHHHHHGGDSQGASAVQQGFNSLGQALQSGNLRNAQTAFASLQQDLQQLSPGGSSNSASTSIQNNGPVVCRHRSS
jgi:hypothetical protein